MENHLFLVVFFNSGFNPLRSRWGSRHLKRRNFKELELGVRSPALWKLILFLFIVSWHSLSFISKYNSSLPSLGNVGHFSRVLAFSSEKLIFYITLNYCDIKKLNRKMKIAKTIENITYFSLDNTKQRVTKMLMLKYWQIRDKTCYLLHPSLSSHASLQSLG